ncbi:AAA family ATPase [Sulfitobacter sp. R18_1]|uniref:AAA family ATPase n=1 Tax=Sulfitobacter sp. R18_1 TaxID=2821104 RepID=UPI001ADC5CF2|nr:AAA family ATPase [Sulfitobacter sp. R18_1]MBO9429539.1 AAA family ATPase [Sulfitobacter sp. R18_1]
MPPSSLSPRASALSPHVLSIMRPLLRRIALWHRDRIAESRVISGSPANFDEGNCDLAVGTGVPPSFDAMLLPPQSRFDALYSATPAASGMTDSEVAEAIGEGFDPWAEEIDTHRTSPLPQPPVASLLYAARFAALLQSDRDIEVFTTPRSFTQLAVASPQDLKVVRREIERILEWLSDLENHLDSRWRGFEIVVQQEALTGSKSETDKREEHFENAIASAVCKGMKVIVLTQGLASLPPVGRAMCQNTLQLPPLSPEISIEVLRVTHSATGEVATENLRALLSESTSLAALPLAVIEGACREPTTLAAAKALADAAARIRKPTRKTLEDVVLNATARDRMDRLVADIRAWRSGNLAWSELSASVLLYGPPGNGKTLLAAALAGSLEVPLISTSYSDCQRHGHQGDMLRALSDKVQEAIRNAPSVFFLDELDSFAHRNMPSRRNDYIVGVVNGLLEHLSVLNDTPGVVVMGATNYREMIDPAIIRTGRFDTHLEIGHPERAAIIRIFEKAIGKGAGQFDLAPLADQLLGGSGAQVVGIVREARGLARSEGVELQEKHLGEAASKFAPPHDQDVLWRMAVHETGHIVVAHHLGLPPARKAMLTNTGGSVEFPESPFECQTTFRNRIATLMAGRAAEQVILGTVSNGAGLGPSSDLAEATRLAGRALFEWGLGTQLAHIPIDITQRYGTAQAANSDVEDCLGSAEETARKIIQTYREDVLRIAETMAEERELSADRISELLSSSEGKPPGLEY